MIKFEKIVAGMTLYDRHKHRMGNTTMSTIDEWKVVIRSVDATGAMVSWNSNRDQRWDRHRLERLFTWSMYGPGVIINDGNGEGALRRIYSVRRAKVAK